MTLPTKNPPRQRGFLPIDTNAFDRFFIATMTLILCHLLWLRFLEPLGLPLWVCTILTLVLGVFIFLRG